MTTWRGAGGVSDGNRINVQTSNGGTVDLSHVATISAGNTYVQALDGGQVNLAALTSFTGAALGGFNNLDARRGGASIVAPSLTNLTNVDLNLGGNATLPVAGLTSFLHGNITVLTDGGSGGMLTLPVSTIDELGFSISLTFRADGTGSRLDLSAVTTWHPPGSASDGNRINVQALNSGTVDLSHVATISAGNTYFQAQDGGQINLSALTSFNGAAIGGADGLDARRGGAITLNSGATAVSNVLVFVDPMGTITAGTLQLASGSSLTGSGTITANLVNDAEVRPDLETDTLVITGNYTQDATGTVIHLGTLTVNGLLTWAGGTMSGAGTTNANGGLSPAAMWSRRSMAARSTTAAPAPGPA